MVSNDAQADSAFLNQVDKATAFVTKSALCVVLNEVGDVPSQPSGTRAVVQLINKLGEGKTFEVADAQKVRSDDGKEILQTCSGIALHRLLSEKDVGPPGPTAAEGITISA